MKNVSRAQFKMAIGILGVAAMVIAVACIGICAAPAQKPVGATTQQAATRPASGAVNINNVTVSAIKTDSVLIRWDSTVAGTCRIEYGETTSYGAAAPQQPIGYFHATGLSGLKEGTTYHYRIRSKEHRGAETVSPDRTFKTKTKAELAAVIRAARVDKGTSKTYYVKTDGNDANDGLTEKTAWKTPAQAVSKADVGDTICLMDGLWNDNATRISFPRSGIDVAPITLKAHHKGKAVIQGDRSTRYQSAKAVLAISKDYIVVSGITIQDFNIGYGISITGNNVTVTNSRVQRIGNSPDGRNGYGSTIAIMSSYVTVSDCTFHDSGWNLVQVAMQRGKKTNHVTITGCDMSKARAHGVLDLFNNLYDASLYLEYMAITNNVFHDQPNYPMLFPHGANPYHMDYMLVRNNVFRNGTTGLVAEYFRNSLVADNVFTNFRTRYGLGAGGSVKVRNNVTFRNNKVSNVKATYFWVAPGETAYFESNDFSAPTVLSIHQGTAVVLDHKQVSWTANPVRGAKMIVRYSDNTVLKTSTTSRPKYYVSSDILYYPAHSQVQLEATKGNSARFAVTRYNMTARPAKGQARINVKKFDTSLPKGKTLVEFTAATAAGNIVTFTVSTLKPGACYLVKKGGADFVTVRADGSGKIAFSNAAWPARGFTIVETDGGKRVVATLR